jgi:hypothetical protein
MNVADGPMLYYLHPDVSFFKGSGFKQLGPYIDMPDNSAAGDVSQHFFHGLMMPISFNGIPLRPNQEGSERSHSFVIFFRI